MPFVIVFSVIHTFRCFLYTVLPLHYSLYFNRTLVRLVRDQSTLDLLAVDGHLSYSLLASCGVIDMYLVYIAAEVTGDRHLLDGIGDAGIYDETVKVRSYTEYVL